MKETETKRTNSNILKQYFHYMEADMTDKIILIENLSFWKMLIISYLTVKIIT